MAFRKVERSYNSTTQNEWRLASYEEVLKEVETIKRGNLLEKWDRVRLLDGWITGGGYNFEMGNDFKGCLGYMLLIQIQPASGSGGPYDDLQLSDRGKEVALFLCVDDWNYELLYCLLNSWSNSRTMNMADVIRGNLPFSNYATKDKFIKMNRMMSHVAIKLGKEAGAALEKARETTYSGKDSITEVMSGMINIVRHDMEIVQCIGYEMWRFIEYEGEEYCLSESVLAEEASESFWSFVCDSFAGYVVEVCALSHLKDIVKMKTRKTTHENFMTATSILLYLSDYRSNIIHEPLAHQCSDSCAEKILRFAEKKAVGVPQSFSSLLQHNAMWRCYDDTGNYDVLSKLLFIVAKGKHAHDLQQVNDGQSISEFVNAKDERGRTALHTASAEGNARICRLLVDCRASATVQDQHGMTALHHAVERGIGDVIDVLLTSPEGIKSVYLKNKEGSKPLDIAVSQRDHESIAKLLPKSNVSPEAYFDRVNQKKLLRNSLILGSVDIVKKLLQQGTMLSADECDEDGKTVFHLAVMCDNESNAFKVIKHIREGMTPEVIREIPDSIRKLLFKGDRGMRTVLHEAALKGHNGLCEELLRLNPELIYMKDRDGQNPLYDAVKAKSASTKVLSTLLDAYLVKDKAEDELTARNGLTPLHVAASQLGKANLVKALLSSGFIKHKYMSKGDIHAQTALHKAVKCGNLNTVEILLSNGAHPLRERDCDGKTALHYAVQAETERKVELASLLFSRCETDEEKSLLYWSSAAGLGTAEDLSKDSGHEGDSLYQYLVAEKQKYSQGNLLQMAACLGDIEMTKELITRGYQIGDIGDPNWKKGLTKPEQLKNVERVSSQIEMIKEQANDKPAVSDNLGRVEYAQGLAALFLNPYIKPPIAVGITGSWGMGKSSLMLQTQRILLTTTAQMALFPSKLSSSDLPGIKPCELSRKGERKLRRIYRYIKSGEGVNTNIFVILWYYVRSKLQKTSLNNIQEELKKFLNEYDAQNLKVFKALAAMDSNDILKTNTSREKVDPGAEENVPAVLTVQYNAWKYRNDREAFAGIAVEITKELEGTMTQAQWLNTCWRNTWRNKKYTIWIEIVFPSLLSLVLVSSFTWITWVVLGSDKLKEWSKAKYAWPPAALVIIVWTLTRSIMGVLKPVSTQLMHYISFPDHSHNLGYHERVISDISFLKDEIGKQAYWVFIVISWGLTIFKVLWGLITDSCIMSIIFHHKNREKAMVEAPRVSPASGSNLRIIVFVDDLDRCQETVILQVLSAVNLVLTVCEISVVMGMDKRLIKRAIIKKYKDVITNESVKDKQELADMYLQKIIQLPLDLPEPSNEESMRFLKGQLGVLENENEVLVKDDRSSRNDDARSSNNDDEEREAVQQNPAEQVEINVRPPSGITETGSSKKNLSSPLLTRETLFVRYSKGEEEVFVYIQGLATDGRKLPREWKRLLNYHRLVWYIFSVSKEAKKLAGWQVQLITWIFVCWEWEDNMNLIIEKWKVSGKKFLTSESNDPSLLMIVEEFMKELTQKLRDEGGSAAETKNEGTESNKEETKTSKEETESLTEDSESTTSRELSSSVEEKLDALEKSMAELKSEMKHLNLGRVRRVEERIGQIRETCVG